MLRKDKIANFIKEMSARFLEEESNRASLITVTNCTVSNDIKNATIYITVLPKEKEASAFGFAKRKRKDIRALLKKSLNTKIIPFIEIEIDRGERNRQRIDELLREK